MAATYYIDLHFSGARLPLLSGRNWTCNLYARRAGTTGALAPISWNYTTTGTETGIDSQYWRTVPDLRRTFTVEVYDSMPTPVVGTLYISQETYDSLDIGTIYEFWADGDVEGAGQNEWSTPILQIPLKLVCEIGQGEIKEPMVCEY